MSEPITITLPESVYRRAKALANRTGRPLNDFLAETIEQSLEPCPDTAGESPVDAWTDEEVLAGAAVTMDPDEDSRLSELLGKQSARTLDPGERGELAALMATYGRLLLRKTQALCEAARRGLKSPVTP